jgi:hypothetical protein
MINIGKLTFNPQTEDVESIKKAIDNFMPSAKEKIEVVLKDFSLKQEDVRKLYLPLVQYAQSLSKDVYCIMPHTMASHLTRNQKLMFVDPAFLNEFKFKRIEFTLPYSPKYKPKFVKTSSDL